MVDGGKELETSGCLIHLSLHGADLLQIWMRWDPLTEGSLRPRGCAIGGCILEHTAENIQQSRKLLVSRQRLLGEYIIQCTAVQGRNNGDEVQWSVREGGHSLPTCYLDLDENSNLEHAFRRGRGCFGCEPQAGLA